jgi:fimbrial chaperone protein
MIRTVRHSLVFAGLFFVHAIAPVVGVVQIAHAQETSAQRRAQARFNVTPTRLVLRPSQTSTSLLLKNESNETIRFQVSAFSWTNAIDGEMKLEPTKEIVFFPALFPIAPGQTRRVRVTTSERATTHERAYRLIVEQLPSRAGPRAEGGVEMMTRLNVPLFLEPGARVARATLDHVALRDGALTFDVHNTGTVHVRFNEIVVKGLSSEGAPAHEQRVPGWYLLPGETRLYQLPLDPHVCRALASVILTTTFAQMPGQTLEERAAVDAGACKAP